MGPRSEPYFALGTGPAGSAFSEYAKYLFETTGGVDSPIRAEATLPDLRAAKIEDVKALGELLTDDGPAFWNQEELTMTVSDASGLILFTLNLAAVKAAALADSPRRRSQPSAPCRAGGCSLGITSHCQPVRRARPVRPTSTGARVPVWRV